MKKACSLTIVAVSLALHTPYTAASCNSWGLPDTVPDSCIDSITECFEQAESAHDTGEWICGLADFIGGAALCEKINNEIKKAADEDCWTGYVGCAQDSCR